MQRVAVAVGQVDGVERLGERADLVDLDQQRVGAALLDARAARRSGLVTNRSSPTSCTLSPRRSVIFFQPSQSSSFSGSSMETSG
jgi:hypothetical protein